MKALLPLALFAACSDYKISSNDDVEGADTAAPVDSAPPGDTDPRELRDSDPPEALVPDVAADPAAIDAGIVCGAHAETVTVRSDGEGDLTVKNVNIDGVGWTVTADGLPWLLAAGESRAVEVEGVGAATLRVISDDPDTPTLSIPLSADADLPPILTLLAPADGDVLDQEVTFSFIAHVEDDLDPPESLPVSWTSSVDGALGAITPDADGLAVLEWRASEHTSGDHAVTATVTDSCGHEAEIGLGICQDEIYTDEDFDLSTWYLAGSAYWDTHAGYLELTGTGTNLAGTAFETGTVVDGSDVEIRFLFYQGDGSGADGIALTALDTERMTGFVGETGGGIGYGGLPGWSIEIDTYYNDVDPTANDHLSVHFDGNTASPAAWSSVPEMENTGWHEMEVTVRAPQITIAIDGVTYIDESIPGYYEFPAYIGFTAATGSLTNNHRIDALTFEGSVCEDE